MKKPPGKLTYANVVSTLCLFLLLGGTAMAAKHYLITSTSQISPKVLKSLQMSPQAGTPGPVGATGATGAAGSPATSTDLALAVGHTGYEEFGKGELARTEFTVPETAKVLVNGNAEISSFCNETSGSEECEVEGGLYLDGSPVGERISASFHNGQPFRRAVALPGSATVFAGNHALELRAIETGGNLGAINASVTVLAEQP